MKTAGFADPIYRQSSMGVKLTLLGEPLSPVPRETLPGKALAVLVNTFLGLSRVSRLPLLRPASVST